MKDSQFQRLIYCVFAAFQNLLDDCDAGTDSDSDSGSDVIIAESITQNSAEGNDDIDENQDISSTASTIIRLTHKTSVTLNNHATENSEENNRVESPPIFDSDEDVLSTTSSDLDDDYDIATGRSRGPLDREIMAQYTEPWESVYRTLRSENLGAPAAAGGRLLSEDESSDRSALTTFYGRIAPENERFYNHIQ